MSGDSWENRKPLKTESVPSKGTTEMDRCTTWFSACAFGIAPNNVAKKLACAAKYGQAHSIGALFGGGTIANFLGGNAVSSLVNLGLGVTG